ncbi:hypothetical protein RIL183_34441 [Roseburia inulinivorans]|uniref:Uncharacterized protein n=2 Tax=Roseburia inulinivorans TaxID=360807 RepID=A0A0M6X0Y5_9FIRM|nr:hypothetical protein RIL183_34441 [Roseburia inulinivorans]
MLDKAEDYLIRSAECVVLGNFTDEVTVLGVGVQIVLGIFDLDLPCDIRDIIADIKNLAETDRVRWDLIGMLALDLIGLIPVIGALKYSDEIGTLFKNADKVSVVARSTDGAGVLAKHADEAGAWLHGVKVFRYSDETAEAVASGEKLLKESGTIYESFADMMSPEDAKRYLDFLENGSREGLTSAELAGVEKADALLVSRKVEYEDVWDLRNVGDALESGLNSNLLDELANSGVKYNPEDIVAITKTADGKLVWLENGTDTAGLNHIITEHADDFLNKGITQEQIPDYVMNALENGKIVGYQGRGTGRPIYEFTYNGEIHKVAITVGNNGFIVGANPK